jgi:hypothetical protein
MSISDIFMCGGKAAGVDEVLVSFQPSESASDCKS